MPLDHDDAPRFTPEQRDAILNLAARLQVQHEATVGADELARAAEEAGLDPRFVHEAAMRLGQKSQTALTFRGPLVAFGLLVLQAFFAMMSERGWWAQHGHVGFGPLDALVAAAIAFLLALVAARHPFARRFVPLAPAIAWAAVLVPAVLLTHGFRPWSLSTAMFYGVVQTVAAGFGALIATLLDRNPPEAQNPGLGRGQGV